MITKTETRFCIRVDDHELHIPEYEAKDLLHELYKLMLNKGIACKYYEV